MTCTAAEYLARRTDPATSRAAADRALDFKAGHEAAIYAAICERGATGVTMHEIARITGLESVQVGRRLGAMGERYLITRKYLPGVCPQKLWQRNGCAVWFKA